jgi:cyclin-dependent kinase-like
MNKYEVLHVVGEGQYGLVLKCRNKLTHELVAVKKFKEPDEDRINLISQREIKMLKLLRHTNIIGFKEYFKRNALIYLIFEFMDKNLLEVLEDKPDGLHPDIVCMYTYQLIRALDYCHSKNVIHRDIKPENLLIDQSTHTLKLCDFGFARYIRTQPIFSYTISPLLASCVFSFDSSSITVVPLFRTMDTEDRLTEYVATRWYRAPEQLLLGRYGFPVDLWGVGCILGEISDGTALFRGENEIDQLFRIQRMIGPLTDEFATWFEACSTFDGVMFPDMSNPGELTGYLMCDALCGDCFGC